MAISRVDTVITPSGASISSYTPTAPTGVVSGDLLIVIAAFSRSLSVFGEASYTGWTILLDLAETAMVTRVVYRIADGTATDTPPTFTNSGTTSQANGIAAAYRGVDQTTPFIAQNGQVESGGSTATVHSAPSLTNTDAGAWGVFAATARQVATPLTWTPGTGLVEQEDADTATATTNNCAATWADTNGTVATGAVTYSGTTSAGTAQAIMWAGLLKPAAGGGGTDYSQTPADAAGLTDSATALLGGTGTGTDALGATDTVEAQQRSAPSGDLTMDIGLAVSRADSLGLADAASPVQAAVRTAADPAGLSDTARLTLGRVRADPLGLTDAVTAVHDARVTVADGLGLSDTATPVTRTGDHLPGVVVLTGDGTSTAALAAEVPGTALLATAPGTAVLAAAAPGTAILADPAPGALLDGDGIGTAALAPSPGDAQIALT